ncbi:microtubule-associated protein futsch-like [Manduca sexta]|uniref:microtubule-associated protein futsch-like n=1 Tax=Manduca sexta TaxID=7130 RepID=UPI00188E50BD|nr:microtubule-associated protein futsch-like [Manduca sexta]
MEPKNQTKQSNILLMKLPRPASDSGVGEAEVIGRKADHIDVMQESVSLKPTVMEAEFARPLDIPIDSESSESCSSMRSKRFWRRHSQRIESNCSLLTSDTDEPASKAQATDGRGRGRPPSVGKYVGLKKAQMERDKLKREETRQKAEKKLAGKLRSGKSPASSKAVEVIENFKGTSQKDHVTEPTLIARLEGEAKRWRENSARLEAAMKQLQEENATLRRRLQEVEAAASKHPTEEMLERMEARMQARLESVLAGPAQRPSLAHERRSAPVDTSLPVQDGYVNGAPASTSTKGKGRGKGKGAMQPVRSIPAAESSSALMQSIAGTSKSPNLTEKILVGKSANSQMSQKGKKKGAAPTMQLATEPRPLPPVPASTETPWTVVASRKSRRAKQNAASVAKSLPQQLPRRAEPKLRSPRSAAVVISLTTAAVQKGLTYAGVLTNAQRQVSLDGLDIDRLRPKYAATGAMLYEVPGADSERKADSLAKRLREYFGGSEDVIVSRPTKCSKLCVSELDPAATPETVTAALCSVGECGPDSIKVGQIRPAKSGMGSVWAKVPTKAALRIKAGRLKIGWTIARVTVLETRPMRCYRCLEHGHVQNVCDGPVDRSNLCYRCGESGHKARQCEGAIKCALCAAAGKPAGHQMGGKACLASSRKTRRRPRRRPAASEATAQSQSASSPQEVEMEVAEVIAP